MSTTKDLIADILETSDEWQVAQRSLGALRDHLRERQRLFPQPEIALAVGNLEIVLRLVSTADRKFEAAKKEWEAQGCESMS